MKKFILSIILALTLFISPAHAEFFTDVIVTSPNGIWTDSRAYTTLNDAIDAVGANDREIVIVNPQVVTALTVPSNVRLKFLRNGSITNSGQLTINSRNIIAEDRQIFTGAGDIDFAVGSIVRSAWFSSAVEAFDVTNDDELTLIISKSAFITANCAVGNNVSLKWESPRNQLTANAGFTLSNIKNIEAGNYQLFAGAGDFDFLDGTQLWLKWFARLRSALNWVEDEEVTIIVNESSTVSYDNTVAFNEHIKFVPGGSLALDAGTTLNLNSQLEGGNYQIISGAGAIAFASGSKVKSAWFSSFETVVTKIGAANVELEVSVASAISNDCTINANTTLSIPSKGRILTIANLKTLTINGPFDAGLYQVFSGDGSVAGLRESNILWFGAISDSGTTDNTSAIKAAYASLVAGGELLIPYQEGYYKYDNNGGLTDAVAITQAVTVQLDGTVKSTSSTNGASPPYIFNVTGDGFVLKGTGTLQGPGTFVVNETTSDNIPGLLKINANDARVSEITFDDPPECAIYIPDKSNIRITNCDFTGGPVVADATSPQHYCILGYGGDNHIISKNRFYVDAGGGACRNAICYGSSVIANSLTITDNQFNSIHEHATYLTAVTNSTVSNNVIRYEQAEADQKGCALKVGGDWNTVIGNTIYNAARGGITTYDASDTVIANNTIYNFGSIGIQISDNVANTVGFNRNIIDSNTLYGRTDGVAVLNGIRYQGTAATTVDCVGGKITNNTISNTGTTTSVNAPIAVYHSNAAKYMIDFDISHNKIIVPKKIAFYLVNVTDSKINYNTIRNPATANSRAFYVSTVTYCTIEGNIVRDDQATALIDYFLNISGAGCNYIELINNACFTTGNVARIGKSGLYNSTCKGNRLSQSDALIGTFTLNNVNNLIVNNANIDEPTATAFYTSVLIWPLNAAAAGIMGSSKSLYINAKVAKTSFTARTGDGVAVPASDHIFGYEIIQ